MKPRLLSLCSGFGGLDHAVEDVFDAQLVAVSDIDPGANKILAHRYPHVPNLGDMTKVDWSTIQADIITGGTPCQDLSHAGKRAGMTIGTRSNLWVSMREAIATIRPSLVVWENVQGAYSAEADSALEQCPRCVGDPRQRGPVLRALGRVLGDLSDLGYVGGWHGLRASDVGACHGRFRVFVVAAPADTNGQGLGSVGWFDTVRRDVDGRGRANRPGPAGESASLLPTPRTSDANGSGAHGDGGLDLRTAVELYKGVTTIRRQECMHHQLGAVTEGVTDLGKYAAAIHRQEQAFGHPAPPPTEPTGKHGTHRLSPRFVEWMMGVQPGWVTDVPGLSRNDQLKALGNGVVRQQAAAAIRHITADVETAVAV